MDHPRIRIDARLRWGTPCLGATGITVAHVIALHAAGHDPASIVEACPVLTEADVAAALAWHREGGDAALGPRPPDPGPRHPRVVVDPDVQGGVPTIRGTRIPVDAVLGLWEQGCAVTEIIDEYPALTPADIQDAVAYDLEVTT
ncbi:MAG TPA: DUF433 domain-containing protein [Acidimicrobiales bacterium]|jgi:uncharacterized protein (DUF433 family)